MCVCLSVCKHACLLVCYLACLSIRLPVCCLPVCLSFRIVACMSVCGCVRLSVYMSINLYACPLVRVGLSMGQYVFVSARLSLGLPARPCVLLPFCVIACVFVCTFLWNLLGINISAWCVVCICIYLFVRADPCLYV